MRVYICKKSKIGEVSFRLLCYTVPWRAQTHFGLNEWRGVWLTRTHGRSF